MRLIIVGPPGGGKGTQAQRICQKLDIPHISTGDIFRKNIKEMTELGKKAKEHIDKGELVPDEITIDMVKDRLSEGDCSNGFLLDGFPRTMAQAEEFDKSVGIDGVIQIDVPDETCVQRIMGRSEQGGGRSDDNEETARQRLRVYHDQTEPILEHYSKKDIVNRVDGTLSVEEVWDSISSILDNQD